MLMPVAGVSSSFVWSRFVGLMLALALVLSFGPRSASANDIRLVESFGAYCNDVYFGSDGGGIGGCIDFAGLLSNDYYFAFGAFQAGPESKSSAKFARDPQNDRGRVVTRVGKIIQTDNFSATATLRFGAQGGFADDFTYDIRKSLHKIFGMNTRAQRGNHSLKGIIGASGHLWNNFEIGSAGATKRYLTPYVHASAGTDNIEGGGGVLLGFQPRHTNRPLPLMEPQSGAYAPFFGDDGFGLFAAARGVAMDSLYGSRAKNFIGEAGFVGQFTVAQSVLGTDLVSCTTRPYDGALDTDCKATLRIGILY